MKSSFLKQFPESAGRGVMNFAFDARDAHVINEPTPRCITISVDEEKPAAGLENALHLRHRAFLVGIMMEAVGAGHEVEGAVGERQAFGISLDGQDIGGQSPPAGRPFSSIPATRSIPQTRAVGSAARNRPANTPVPQPMSNT